MLASLILLKSDRNGLPNGRKKAQPSDEQLVVRVQKGDKRAFDLLVLKYQQKVHSIVGRFVRDTDEVADVVRSLL